MKSLWSPDARAALSTRIDRLTPDTQPRWGRMNAGEMLLHVTDGMRLGLGELETKPRRSIFWRWPLNHLFIYWLPFPKGVRAPRELVTRGKTVDDWPRRVAELHASIERFAARDLRGAWPTHPLLGPLDGRAWGALGWRHLDHHLRQFGV